MRIESLYFAKGVNINKPIIYNMVYMPPKNDRKSYKDITCLTISKAEFYTLKKNLINYY